MRLGGTPVLILGTVLLISAGLGCLGGSSVIAPPSIDPEKAARAAMSEYDADNDGAIAGDELKYAASLSSIMAEIDADADKRITPDEIASCLTGWLESGTNLVSSVCTVRYQGRPIDSATVVLEPEKFLGEGLASASGVTNTDGTANLTNGVAPGFYKVRITKNDVIPEKYNSATELGQAVSPNGRSHDYEFNLNWRLK